MKTWCITIICAGSFLLLRKLLLLAASSAPTQKHDHHSHHNARYNALCSSENEDIGWEFAGPTTYVNQFGDDESPKLASAAAIQKVVEGANGTWFIGSVNGGVWRSTNLQAAPNLGGNSKVHWENVLDTQPVTCSSISALHVSSSTPNTVYAGCGGSTSSEQGLDWNVVNSGDWGGIMVSKDVGSTWNMMESFPENYYVTDILEIDPNVILVAAQSHLWDRNDGGIWRSVNGGDSFERVSSTPTFTMTQIFKSSLTVTRTNKNINEKGDDNQQVILATHAHSADHTASISANGGLFFEDLPLPWTRGAVPFYTCAVQLSDGRLVVAGLTRLPGGRPDNTGSQIFILKHPKTTGWSELTQPTRMDEDSMPKDRMALLADPEYDDLLYVAGNAGALAWRVNMTTGAWEKLWDDDVTDGSIPHGDCRNYAWDNQGNRLIIVSDGGIFARIQPRESGGHWISLNGDYSGLELLSAHYDPQSDRYVAGAQDNCAIVTKSNATRLDVGYGFVEGDGTVTMVDSNAKPGRLFGTTQFLGVGTIENDPSKNSATIVGSDDDDDDDNCGGLCFAQGDKFIQVEVGKYFPEPSSFPFFVHPYTLNKQDHTLLHFWVNGSAPHPSAFYEFSIPYSVKDKDDIGAPTKVLESPPGAMIMDFVSGGVTSGKADPNLLLGISNTHLYVRSLADNGPDNAMLTRKLPVVFAKPVTLEYDDTNDGARILGPLTHARTVFMTVSTSDSRVIAITGWPSVDTNMGNEDIYLTTDAGQQWQNITGNLREVSGVSGKVRPGGMLLVELSSSSKDGNNNMTRALLVGTSNGMLVTFISPNIEFDNATQAMQKWVRLGTCGEFPIVLTADIDYEPTSDRLVAATYGRGIYILRNAKEKLLHVFNRMKAAAMDDSDIKVI